ncbi:MAG TPA: cysteine--tRNA ligase [Sphingobacteriaceae bacterium]|nr:cysteine--tRNA ligase [Sphingobacteriaceae bacterium]
MEILIYDTLSGEKEPIEPREDGLITMYTCGPTVYDSTHVGHLIPPVVGDVVKRFLESRGCRVKWAHNFTDVEDKIIRKANELGTTPEAVAERYIQEYLEVMDAMGIDTVDVYPRVSEHMEDIVNTIADLVDKGAAYVVNGDVYFDVARFPEYGQLSGRNVEELLAGARIEPDPRKRNPADFALWKSAKPGEPSWPSPWGPGRPGWHIECSVMSVKHLGYPIDIHGGGIDLIFPHHENEIAQAEAHQGKGPFVRHWLHTGLLTMGDEKMSKSLGNFHRAKDMLERFGPMVLRFFILSHHYRSPREYSLERLEEARRAWQRLHNAVGNLREVLASAPAPGAAGQKELPAEVRETLQRLADLTHEDGPFDQAMADDFNTPQAIGVLFQVVREVNSLLGQGKPGPQVAAALRGALDFLMTKGRLLGILGLEDPAAVGDRDGVAQQLLDLLLDIRQDAREQRDWALADRIRDGLAELGIIVEDTASGARVRWERR